MRLLWIMAAAAFLVDQGSKFLVFAVLDLWNRNQVDVLPPLLVFRPGMNTGINFGLLGDGNKWILIGIALVLCAGLLYWARHFRKRIEFISGGLVLGGALGNVLDRLLHPGVLDFLNMSCCGISNPYVFNLADVYIFAGALGLAFFTETGGPQGKRRKARPKKAP